MGTKWEDTEFRCPPTLHTPSSYRYNQFRPALLFETEIPLEHREASRLRLPSAAFGLYRSLGNELFPGEEGLPWHLGLATATIAVDVMTAADNQLHRWPDATGIAMDVCPVSVAMDRL